jgi:hypothetical protein
MNADMHGATDHRRRAEAAARMAVLGLERDLPRVALIGAQAAARSALLALGDGQLRRASRDLRTLQELAALDRGRMAATPDAQREIACDALAVLLRLLRQPPVRRHASPWPAIPDFRDAMPVAFGATGAMAEGH